MIKAEVLIASGIDYQAGLSHFLNDTVLYERVLRAFIEDDVVDRARRAYDMGDKAALLSAVHEAKGTSGNTNLDEVYRLGASVVDLLRNGAYSEEALDEKYISFERAYREAQGIVRSALE